MAKRNKKITFSSISRALNDFNKHADQELKSHTEALAAKKEIQETMNNIILKRDVKWTEVSRNHDNIIILMKYMRKHFLEYIPDIDGFTNRSTDVFNPFNVLGNPNDFNLMEKVDDDELRMELYDAFFSNNIDMNAFDKLGEYLVASPRGALKIALYDKDFLEIFDEYLEDINDRIELLKALKELVNTFNIGISLRVTFDEKQIKTLCDVLDAVYDDWRLSWDLMPIFDYYNGEILKMRMQKINVEKLKNQPKEEVKEKNDDKRLDNGYNNRINEIVNYNISNDLSRFSAEECEIINKYATNSLNITKEHIIELDSLLCSEKASLVNTLMGYSERKRSLYYNLLIRTYLAKHMDNELKELTYMITDIEMKKFDHARFLESKNLINDLTLFNNYKSLVYELSLDKQNCTLYNEVNNELNNFMDVIYFYSTGVYSEKEFLTETAHFAAAYQNVYSAYTATEIGADNMDEILSTGENYVILLTDDENISYAEHDIESEIKNPAVRSIVCNQIGMLKHINIHDFDPHKFKSNDYSVDLLKKLHFKSFKKVHTRIFYGKFANEMRESMIIVYGAHNGSMDNNSKEEYGRSTLKNCQANMDKIEYIVNAFANKANNPDEFNNILDRNDEAIKHLEEFCNDGGSAMSM